MRGQRGQLIAVNFSSEIGKRGCDGIDSSRGMNIAKQIESRQFGGRYLHDAGIGLAFHNAVPQRPPKSLRK